MTGFTAARWLCAVLFVALFLSSPARAAPRVITSIAPVHSLVAGVMDGVGAPDLLVSPAASAHTYALRPSEARLLNRADVVFWIGPIYESFLEKPLAALGSRAKIVPLMDAPGVAVLRAREGGPWEEHDDEGHDHAHDTNAPIEEADGHLFLDPRNARAIVRAVVETLTGADAENAPRYRGNGEAVLARLDALDADLRAALAPVRGKPFIVFHDAYQYLEQRYALNAMGSITVSPERQPGAQRVQRLRRKVTQLKAVCVFAEPQFEPTLVRTIIEGTKARAGVLDPLGALIEPGPNAYFEMMRAIARSLTDCMQG